MTATALVVDDEVDLCRLMQITLTKMGIKSDVAYDLAQAKAYWQDNEYDFCLTDLQLPDGSGLDLVKLISSSSTVPVAVITAHGSMDLGRVIN
jgi:two-component system response regulator PilR (NtrC family)